MKKLLLLLLIAVVGAGISLGANAVFFSPASNERPAIEPRGLVDEIAADDVTDEPTPEASATPKPSPSPEPVAAGDETSSSGGPGAAPVPAPPADDDGPREPRSPSGGGDPQATSFVVQGVVDDQDQPDDPCDLEESERERQQCENEADREEDEADQEQNGDDGSND